MYSIYSTTGNLVPGPKDTKYSYLCPKCNGGSHRLRHLPKTWLVSFVKKDRRGEKKGQCGERENGRTFCNTLPKFRLQVISTALFNMTHRIGVDVIHSMKPSLVIAGSHAHTNTGEGNGGNGWYPFFDIDSEICPFIHHFWDQLTPHNSCTYLSLPNSETNACNLVAHRGWCSFVLTTAAGHPDLFMSSKRGISPAHFILLLLLYFSTTLLWLVLL